MDIQLPFAPADWYWRSDTGRVYSSKAGKVVTKDDAGYMAWGEAGGVPTVWPRDDEGSQTQAAMDAVLANLGVTNTATVPDVTSAQALIQLSRTPGSAKDRALLDDVTDAIKAAGVEAGIWFARAQTWQRTNPYIAQIGKGLGLPDSAIDDLFRQAAKIAA